MNARAHKLATQSAKSLVAPFVDAAWRAVAALVFAASCALPAAADDGLRDLCPDRPGKNTSACTLDAGHFQIESDLFNATFQHSAGVTTDTYFVTNPTLKYGVTGSFDVEANIVPYEIVRTHDSSLGTATTAGGIGDLFLRAKWAAIGNGGSDFALVIEPYLKIPTAPHSIGNGSVEGGALLPAALSLGDDWSLAMTPEVDVLRNATDSGHHLALSDVVGLSRAVGGGVTLGAEVWGSSNFDPLGSTQQYSADLDAAWIPVGSPNLQFDAGANFGLNRNTPGAQAYVGVSQRY